MDASAAIYALVGGLLIGLAASLLLLTHGRIAGVSGMLAGFLGGDARGLRLSFLAGLLTVGVVVALTREPSAASTSGTAASLAVFGVGGFLVGVGTGLSNGCTSGHGVCGNARLSRRSLIATATFITTGALTVFVVRHLVGGAS